MAFAPGIPADKTLGVMLRADNQQFLSAINSSRLATTAFKIAAVGAAAAVGVAFLKFSSDSVRAAIEFETAFAGVRKTVDATEQQFAALNQGILEMSRNLPAGTTEIAAVGEAAGQLGIQTENILGFTRTMIDLGETTNLQSNEAAKALSRLANITQLPQSQFDRLGSTIVDLGNNLATTEAEIVEMGLRIAGAGHQVGLTTDQVLSFAGALSSVGIRAEQGGTAISRVMIEIANSVANADERLSTFAETANMSPEQFAQAWQKDAAAALVSFIEGLGEMQQEGENVFNVLDELQLGGIRVRDALLRASGAGDLFRESLVLGNEAWTENTALTEEAEKRYETTAAQIEMAKNRVHAFQIEMGNELLPVLEGAVGWFLRATESTEEFAQRSFELISTAREEASQIQNLVDRFIELRGLPSRTAQEQEELNRVMQELIALAPEFSGALQQNTEDLRQFTESVILSRHLTAQEREIAIQAELKNLEAQRESMQQQLEMAEKSRESFRELNLGTSEWVQTIAEGSERIETLRGNMSDLDAQIESLNRSLNTIGLQSHLDRANRIAMALHENFESAGDAGDDASESIGQVAVETRTLAEIIRDNLTEELGILDDEAAIARNEFELWELTAGRFASATEVMNQELAAQQEELSLVTEQIDETEAALQRLQNAGKAQGEVATELRRNLSELRIEHAELRREMESGLFGEEFRAGGPIRQLQAAFERAQARGDAFSQQVFLGEMRRVIEMQPAARQVMTVTHEGVVRVEGDNGQVEIVAGQIAEQMEADQDRFATVPSTRRIFE